MPLVDVSGRVFGRLTVRHYDTGAQRWVCACSCGAAVSVMGSALRSGRTKSCGCLNRDMTVARNTKHGAATRSGRTAEYKVWCGIIHRCTNPSDKSYPSYGGRGISVCDRWRHGEGGRTGFECFLSDVGLRPAAGYEIDRIDTLQGYAPGNCRWLPRAENVRNRRDARMVTFRGERMGLAAACEAAGLGYDLVWDRLHNGWSEADALTTPKAAALSLARGQTPGDTNG